MLMWMSTLHLHHFDKIRPDHMRSPMGDTGMCQARYIVEGERRQKVCKCCASVLMIRFHGRGGSTSSAHSMHHCCSNVCFQAAEVQEAATVAATAATNTTLSTADAVVPPGECQAAPANVTDAEAAGMTGAAQAEHGSLAMDGSDNVVASSQAEEGTTNDVDTAARARSVTWEFDY